MLRTKEPTAEDKKLQEQVALILANHHADNTKDDVLARLGAFLNKDAGAPGLGFLNNNTNDNDSNNNTGSGIATALTVLTTILRLFVFRG
jgi:hypothetical protein